MSGVSGNSGGWVVIPLCGYVHDIGGTRSRRRSSSWPARARADDRRSRLAASIIFGTGFASLDERKDAGQMEKPDALDSPRFTDGHGTDETFCRPLVELRARTAGIKLLPALWCPHPHRQIAVAFADKLCGAGRRGLIASVTHARTGRRHGAQKIFPFTIHTTETLCEAATGPVCHTHRISEADVTQSVLSICPIASAKQANRFLPDPQWIGIRTGATYRFWTGQALLLVKTRFLRPRNGRGEIAICPGKWPRRCPQPRSVRVRSGAVSSPQLGHVRFQSVTASASATWPWAARVRVQSMSVTVAGPRMSASSPHPRTIRVQSASAPDSPPAPRESPFDCVARCASSR